MLIFYNISSYISDYTLIRIECQYVFSIISDYFFEKVIFFISPSAILDKIFFIA